VIHGNQDHEVPFYNGKKMYDRALEVGLPADLIELEAGHDVILWKQILSAPVMTRIMDDLVLALDLDNAEKPDNCN
jgi:hypothetical protein